MLLCFVAIANIVCSYIYIYKFNFAIKRLRDKLWYFIVLKE